jgi:hypothetical protein
MRRRFVILTTLTLAIVVTLTGVRAGPAQYSDRIRGSVWTDANCDGVRQADEALLPMVRLTLRWAGDNGTIDATDNDIEQVQSLTGPYFFWYAGAGMPYFVSVRTEDRPRRMYPAPLGPDNALTDTLLPGTTLWATPVFTMPLDGSMVTGKDIGLCTMPYGAALPAIRR